ncbi:MAG: hypothetical protein V1495_04220 [Pseudomonadota bacterium]
MMNFSCPLISTVIAVVLTSSAFAQGGDVCCVLGKKIGESASTTAVPRSPSQCVAGTVEDGQTVCLAKSDPNNDCPMLGEKERCSICGFFWAGKDCLSSDPVKKAKEELKKEEEKKKKGTPKPEVNLP